MANLKLSEAIIEGCKGTYQIRIQYTDEKGGYCVAGAALRPELPPLHTSWWEEFCLRFPITSTMATHPETGAWARVGGIVISLSDWHLWPRLSIAEWVANRVEGQ